jgi:hypothetical protein
LITPPGGPIAVSGKWLKLGSIRSEEWLEEDPGFDPEHFIASARQARPRVDIFTFRQKLPDVEPRYSYSMVWDNVASIPITSYSDWWDDRLPQVTRKNVRRAAKRGVTARVVQFNDELVGHIIEVHNDTLIRQGGRFSHFGKDAATVKREYSSFLERSLFIGAFAGEEMIGFLKLVFVGPGASILNILSKTTHYDKRPTNVLVAKAVEACVERGLSYLTYGKYTYGNKTDNSLTEFKRRTGFEEVPVPRYFVALSLRGRLAMCMRLHLGLIGILPGPAIALLVKARGLIYRRVVVPLHPRLRAELAASLRKESNLEKDTD